VYAPVGTQSAENIMKVHYLEIVSLDVDAVCKAYGATHNVTFGEADPLLGGARTCTLPDGSIIGVRAPLRDTENPVVRPYWLVEGIEEAVTTVEAQGAEIAVPPMEIPGRGKFAIYLLGSNEHGLWQL
jgi:uncharacterized protein